MVVKQKKLANQLNETAMQVGVLLMSAAMALGLAEMPQQPDKRAVLPARPALAPATADEQGNNGLNDNSLRREREETGPHYVSYGATQRTPARTGKA